MLGMRNKAGTSKIGKPGVPGSKAVGVAGIVTGVKKKKRGREALRPPWTAR